MAMFMYTKGCPNPECSIVWFEPLMACSEACPEYGKDHRHLLCTNENCLTEFTVPATPGKP